MSIIAKVKKIFVASNIAGLSVAVQKLLPTVEVIDLQQNQNEPVSASDRCRIEQEAEVLLADTPEILNVLYFAKQLKWAQTTWAGVEKLIRGMDLNKPLPCLLTRTGGAFNKIMAEYVLGYILAKERFILDVYKEQEKGCWNNNGWLGGAVLDVFAEEPLPKESPLWSLPGVLITPHIAGVSLPKQVAKSFVDNFNLLLENKQLKFLVDANRGY